MIDGQQGIVNEKGVFTPSVQPHKPAPAPKPLYPDSYDIPPSFYKGFAVCHQQGKYGILKTDGNYLFPMVYTAINWNDDIDYLLENKDTIETWEAQNK